MNQVFVALGSNLNDPIRQVENAIQYVISHVDIQERAISSLYRSPPLNSIKQPDYINAVIAFETDLTPEKLLNFLQSVEKEMGRVRTKERWGPRTIDLDILLYGNEMIATEDLTIPHYGLHERDFFLYPLAEIAPDLVLPTGESIQTLIQHLTDCQLSVVNPN